MTMWIYELLAPEILVRHLSLFLLVVAIGMPTIKLLRWFALTSGVVVFASPEKGMEFEAPLDSEGAFSVKSSYGDGAPEGTYKIRIQADVTKPGEAKGRSRRAAANLLYPAKYGDETTSGLTAVVKPADNDLEPFALAK